ncbi:MAG TPA: agmatine deiminase family protein [Thermoplasmata archaeon]|nr:agmatine deiminase family protein [Thermoplasmata archaeon]
MTDKVFVDNEEVYGRDQLRRELQEFLRVEDLLVIPKEPLEEFGHADGVVRFLDERTIVINDYSEVNPSYRRRLTSTLRRARLKVLEVPYAPREGNAGDVPPATGCYVNFLWADDLLVVPAYGIEEDERAFRALEKVVPASMAAQVDCREVTDWGGSLHCFTWQA